MAYLIRSAQPDDVQEISRVIVATLRESNAKDYSGEVIARLEQSFSPAAVSNLLAQRVVFVAVDDDVVIGTASFDGKFVRTVFIEPSWQGRGIGRALMARIERVAREEGLVTLAVRSSVTAKPFYTKLGFVVIRDNYDEKERTIVMERPLLAAHGV